MLTRVGWATSSFLLALALLGHTDQGREEGGDAAREGLQVLARAQKAAGGAERLAAIRDSSRILLLTEKATLRTAERIFKFIPPSTILQEDRLPDGSAMTAFYDGEQGLLRSPWGDDRLPAWQLAAAQQDGFRQLETLLLSDRMPSRSVAFIEREAVDERETDVIEIAEAGQKVRLWVESGSGRLVKMSYPQMTTRGEGAPREDVYLDVREISGILLPSRVMTYSSGVAVMESLVQSVEYNTGLDAESLRKQAEPPPKP